MLRDVLGSQVKAKILLRLFKVSQATALELSQSVQLNVFAIKSQLAELEKATILSVQSRRGIKCYNLNKQYALYEELHALIAKAIETGGDITIQAV